MNEQLGPFLEGGIAIAIFSSVMGLVIVPVVKAFITSQRDALDLLRVAVEQNTEAIKAFQSFEAHENDVHASLIATQERILGRLDDLFTHNNGTKP